MEYKRYSAFLSSNYTSLIDERTELIECLLDAQIIPICMEHFTATSSENFDYIKTLIDQSDIFVMLLGDTYGSCDADGVSWTEREYKYAIEKKICYVLKLDGYQTLLSRYKNGDSLTDDQQKQIRFGESISYAQKITPERNINKVVQQIIAGTDFERCIGWTRRSELFEEQWKKENRYLDLNGKWYHLHLKEDDNSYIRAGSVTIEQDFAPDTYKNLKISANNYSVNSIDPDNKTISLNKLKRTVWSGDYLIKDDSRIIGVYNAERSFKGEYNDWVVEKGVYRGVHLLSIVDEDNDGDSTDQTIIMAGTFNDVYPSPKTGLLYLFRSKEIRYNFLEENFGDVLRSKT